mmetsp:Transcript_37842/g.60684  ORF Transcript_37842/g.60684 Transcript_37842/m.60684 type:complete len:116 (-) Transcript_37842:551-898(-)
MTYLSFPMSDRMTRDAFRRCFTSRYDEGSSNMYTSASCTATTAIAKRCSSPPESALTSRSSTFSKSSSTMSSSVTPRSSRFLSVSNTSPLTAFGMWSTYCGLMSALMSSSKMRVR